MKRLPKYLALSFSLVLVASISASFAYQGNQPLKEVEGVAEFVDPNHYYTSKKVQDLVDRNKGQGKVLFPKLIEDIHKTKTNFIRQSGFVGPESCRECHQEFYDGFIETSHFRTSSLPTPNSMLGTFGKGENQIVTRFEGLSYEVVQEVDKFFQTIKLERDGKTYRHKQEVGIVTGSGNLGQTHLYWQDNYLYELPVSWFTSSGWVNSPGYTDGVCDLARPMKRGCLSCHVTMMDEDSVNLNRFDPKTMILGVTCERCHGPGAQHVDYHRQNPTQTESQFIVNPDELPRERMNDVCGQCHTGTSRELKSLFGFRPGDSIHDFKRFPPPEKTGTGVHTANQHPRLVKSKCYLESPSMNCATCHNPHQNEHAQLALFSEKCIKCHQPQACGQFAHSGQRITENCIDCHMPKRQDKKTKMKIGSKQIFPQIRDHYIRINPEATKIILQLWKETETESKTKTEIETEIKAD